MYIDIISTHFLPKWKLRTLLPKNCFFSLNQKWKLHELEKVVILAWCMPFVSNGSVIFSGLCIPLFQPKSETCGGGGHWSGNLQFSFERCAVWDSMPLRNDAVSSIAGQLERDWFTETRYNLEVLWAGSFSTGCGFYWMKNIPTAAILPIDYMFFLHIAWLNISMCSLP